MRTIPDPSSTKEDKQLWRRWRPWLIVALVVIGTLAVLALTLVVLPPWLVRAPVNAGFVDRVKAENDARGNLVAGLGVLAALTGGIIGFLNFRESQRQNLRSLELSRRGQLSERFSKAIEQLGQGGEERVDVRIGAIYSLEQIARDSPDELHGPIIESRPRLGPRRDLASHTPPRRDTTSVPEHQGRPAPQRRVAASPNIRRRDRPDRRRMRTRRSSTAHKHAPAAGPA